MQIELEPFEIDMLISSLETMIEVFRDGGDEKTARELEFAVGKLIKARNGK